MSQYDEAMKYYDGSHNPSSYDEHDVYYKEYKSKLFSNLTKSDIEKIDLMIKKIDDVLER